MRKLWIIPILFIIMGFSQKNDIEDPLTDYEIKKIYRILNKLSPSSSTGEIEEEEDITAPGVSKKLYLRDIRAEQRYIGAGQTGDRGQSQVDTLYGTALFRIAGVDDLYRTVDGTLIYFSSGTAYTITLDGTTGQSEWKGSMIHYSTNSYFTTAGTRTIKINGYISDGSDELERAGDVNRGNGFSFNDEFSAYPDIVNDWTDPGGNVSYYNGTLKFNWTNIKARTFSRRHTFSLEEGDLYVQTIGFRFGEDNKYVTVTVGNSANQMLCLQQLGKVRYNGSPNVDLGAGLDFTGTSGFIRLEERSGSSKYYVSIGGRSYNGGQSNDGTGTVGGHFNVSTAVDSSSKAEVYLDYYREQFFDADGGGGASGFLELADVSTMTTLSFDVSDDKNKKGFTIENDDGKFRFTADGGFGVFGLDDALYDNFSDQGADSGRVAIYNSDDVGIDFYVDRSTYPQSIIYDGDRIKFSTTTEISGALTVKGIITGTITYAQNSDQLDGEHGSYYATASSMTDIHNNYATEAEVLTATASLTTDYDLYTATNPLVTVTEFKTSTDTLISISSAVALLDYKLDESSATATYMNVLERGDFAVYNATATAYTDLLKSTQTFTGGNTFSDSVTMTVLEINSSINMNGNQISDPLLNGAILNDNMDANNNSIIDLSTTPSAGYATAKEYVDYAIRQGTANVNADTLDGQHGAYYAIKSAVATSTDTLQANIDTNETAISTTGTQVASNLSQISLNEVAIGTNTTAISTLESGKLDNTSDTMSGSLDIGTTLDVTGNAIFDSKMSVSSIIKTWTAGWDAMHLGFAGTISGYGTTYNTLNLSNNAYNNSGWKYINNGYGSAITMNEAGAMVFETYTSGTANAAITRNYRMSIINNGDVGISDTTPSYKLDVNGTGRFVGALTVGNTIYADGFVVQTKPLPKTSSKANIMAMKNKADGTIDYDSFGDAMVVGKRIKVEAVCDSSGTIIVPEVWEDKKGVDLQMVQNKLIKALQEAFTEISDMKARIEELEK